jgi:hypothetical protein
VRDWGAYYKYIGRSEGLERAGVLITEELRLALAVCTVREPEYHPLDGLSRRKLTDDVVSRSMLIYWACDPM